MWTPTWGYIIVIITFFTYFLFVLQYSNFHFSKNSMRKDYVSVCPPKFTSVMLRLCALQCWFRSDTRWTLLCRWWCDHAPFDLDVGFVEDKKRNDFTFAGCDSMAPCSTFHASRLSEQFWCFSKIHDVISAFVFFFNRERPYFWKQCALPPTLCAFF